MEVVEELTLRVAESVTGVVRKRKGVRTSDCTSAPVEAKFIASVIALIVVVAEAARMAASGAVGACELPSNASRSIGHWYGMGIDSSAELTGFVICKLFNACKANMR